MAWGFFNINVMIQIFLILNFECVHKYNDKVKGKPQKTRKIAFFAPLFWS